MVEIYKYSKNLQVCLKMLKQLVTTVTIFQGKLKLKLNKYASAATKFGFCFI